MKPSQLTATASADVERAFEHYLAEAGSDTAARWLDMVDAALRHIARHPGTGSPRYAEQLGLPGLRFWLTDVFPYAVFYVERETHTLIIRVLHQHADLPAHLT